MTISFWSGGEVPATKLAALQKVLQSEFLNAVREVYEHVYETVDVQGNPEIRWALFFYRPVQELLLLLKTLKSLFHGCQ